MPKIDGQTFPDYEFREFPKTLYLGGDLQGESRIVASAGEQEAAADEGFVDVLPVPPEVTEDTDLSFPEPPAGSAIDSDPHHVLLHDGAPDDREGATDLPPEDPAPDVNDAFNGADPAAFDHDGDGAPGGSAPRAKRAKT